MEVQAVCSIFNGIAKNDFLTYFTTKYASGHILENVGFSFNLNLSVYDKANS